MTDQEFKRLSRAQLIDVIYQLQLQIDQLTEEKESLEKALEDKRLRIHNAGNLAEAAGGRCGDLHRRERHRPSLRGGAAGNPACRRHRDHDHQRI